MIQYNEYKTDAKNCDCCSRAKEKKFNIGVSEQSQWKSQGPACMHEYCLSDVFLPELLTEIN